MSANAQPETVAPRGEAIGLAAVSVQTVLSIASFFIAKEALHGIPASVVILLRSTGAAAMLGLCVLLAAAIFGAPILRGVTRRDFLPIALLGIAGVPFNQGLFLAGLQRTTPAHAALLYALTPALVLLIGARRGTDRVTRARVAGIVLALLGVAVVLIDAALHPKTAAPDLSHQAAHGNPVLGDLMILGAVCAWASYTAGATGVVARLGAVRATFGALSFGALVYLPIGLFFGARSGWVPAETPAAAWWALAWLIVMSSTVAYLCWYVAIRRLDPSRVAIFINLQPIGTALTQWAVFALPFGPAFLAGAALAVAGVVLAQRRAPATRR